jgi:nitroimidazol reductase NimA-like FMN-containing flavoprotein (pyridoxamine 5'-phosphate oxidase superfamily)
MYGALNDREMDALLARHRYGRLGYTLEGQIYIVPINYAYEGGVLYGHAAKGTQVNGAQVSGTKVRGMRQNPTVAFEVDEIQDAAHWRSVLLHGRFVELQDTEEQRHAFARIVAQAGGGERSEVSWALDLEHLVLFRMEITSRTGRFEERESFEMRPGRKGPLPVPTQIPTKLG